MERAQPGPSRLAALQATLVRLSRALDAAQRDGLGALQLTPGQVEVLRFAGSVRPDVATLSQLARVLGVRHPTAVGIVRPLLERGLVERRPHPYDARRHSLALTPAGRQLVARLDEVESELAGVLQGLAPQEVEALERGLGALVRGLRNAGTLVLAAPCRGCIHFEEDAAAGLEAPHRCRLIRRYLTDAESRMNCPEHTAA